MAGAPSVVIDTNLHTGIFVLSIKVLKIWKMSSPRVCAFICKTVKSSSFAVISWTIRIKMHNWALSVMSVDSSICSEKHSQQSMSLASCCTKLSPIISHRLVTVFLVNWTALTADIISVLFLNSLNNASDASMKASFTITPSWKHFLCLTIVRLTRNDASVAALAFDVGRVKRDCCPRSWDFNSLTFLFLNSLLGGKSVSKVRWTIRKCLSTFPFFGSAMLDRQIRQTHFECDIVNKKSSSHSWWKW